LKQREYILVVAAVAGLFGESSLCATTITGLHNTGVDGSGVLLTGTGMTDPHYTVLSGPGLLAPTSAVTFNCCYFADGPNSRFISVNSSGQTASSGSYLFETTFSLAGFNPATAQISGQFAADNHITATRINGTTVPGATTDTFTSYTSFTINSGFVAGLNTLDLVVLDDGVVMSLRVDSLSGTASPNSSNTPEPGTMLMLSSGLALAAFRFRLAKR